MEETSHDATLAAVSPASEVCFGFLLQLLYYSDTCQLLATITLLTPLL